jgi:long-chain acyl-CoA synthetase
MKEKRSLETRFWQQSYDYNVPTNIRYPKFPVQNFVHLAAAQYPHKAAVDFCGATFTNTEVRDAMLRMANALGHLGVSKGDRVGIALPNCPQYIIAYYAVLSAGAIVVNMNPLYTRSELLFMMHNTEMKVLFTYDTALDTMGPLAAELGCTLIVTQMADFMNRTGAGAAEKMSLQDGWYSFPASSHVVRHPSAPDRPLPPAIRL